MHTVAGFYVTTGFVVLGVGACAAAAKANSRDEATADAVHDAVAADRAGAAADFPGRLQGLNTLQYQPAKLAAIEAHWNREARAPLTLFAIPDQKAETNHAAIEVPLLGSLILTHDLNGVVPGLKDFPRADRAAGDHSLLRLPHHGGTRAC